jgi:hypothetical protein
VTGSGNLEQRICADPRERGNTINSTGQYTASSPAAEGHRDGQVELGLHHRPGIRTAAAATSEVSEQPR